MNKIISRILCILLCAGILLSFILPAFAAEEEPADAEQTCVQTITISNVEEFLSFAESCRLDSFSVGMEATLTADIDLSGEDFAGIPIFCGTFSGGDHTISGLSITSDGSNVGLFRYLTATAVVQDLTVEGEVSPQGSRTAVGGIAGSNAGAILNCTFRGTVSGNEAIGGIAGTNTMTGIIENCGAEGTIHGNHFIGGIAGENSGVIRSCANSAQINTTSQQNSVEISDITMDTLTGSESASTVTDIGGIAGSSSGVIRDCENRGNVGYKHMGYNIGGIAGTQSGHISGCENYGEVSGRKEVGGIVGQMEPMALIEYDEDALQILQQQLDSMGRITNQTAANMQNSATEITSQVESIQGSIQNAKDAVNALIPGEEEENPTLPDMDALQAAQNTLSESLTTISQELNGISSTTQSAMGTLNNNLYALQKQISAMSATVGNMSDTLGGSLKDVSDLDTELDLSGKVADCRNYGSVLADMNAGGIVGAMAMENDLDPEDDLDIIGESSLNFESQLRAVVLDCVNNATVTATKQNVGGVVGWMSMGLVKNCLNQGAVDAESADYAGGIAGMSSSYIRGSSAKCQITGDTYVGGIAGSGTIVTDCRGMVLLSGTESTGAILGQTEENYTDVEVPVSGNYYMALEEDLGGIDGISYAGQAEALAMEDFLALEDLPSAFQAVTVSFRFENGSLRSFYLAPGGSMADIAIPELPEKEGYTAVWEGLAEAAASPVTFDLVLEANYIPLERTIQSNERNEAGLPLLLAEGSFDSDMVITLSESPETPVLENGTNLLETAAFSIPGSEAPACVRYLLPEDCDTDHLILLVRDADGQWKETEYTVRGSYLTFNAVNGENQIALVRKQPSVWPLAAAGIGVVLIAVLAILLLRKKKKAKK